MNSTTFFIMSTSISSAFFSPWFYFCMSTNYLIMPHFLGCFVLNFEGKLVRSVCVVFFSAKYVHLNTNILCFLSVFCCLEWLAFALNCSSSFVGRRRSLGGRNTLSSSYLLSKIFMGEILLLPKLPMYT